MSTRPYMPFFVGDFLADTGHLNAEETGAYILLIMSYWQRAVPLPDDPQRLALIAKVSNDRWLQVERTLRQYFKVENGVWKHKRIDAELDRVKIRADKAKDAGKASGEARRQKNRTDVPSEFELPTNERSSQVATQSELGGNQPNPTQRVVSKNPLTPMEAETAGVLDLKEISGGVGVGATAPEPSTEAKRKVCEKLQVKSADSLAKIYTAWQLNKPPSKRARDHDALFVKSAPTMFGRMTEAERKLLAIPIEISNRPPSKPSPQLLAKLKG